jgi:outer membrane protein assembly factor BamB
MSRRRLCTWALVALAGATAWADEDYVPAEPLRAAGMIKTWQLRLPLDKGQELADVYLVDDQLYAATNDGYVFAIHADTGANRWLRHVTSEGYRVGRPCHAGERVIFVTPTTILELNRLTGEGVLKHELDIPAGTFGTTDGTYLYVGGLDRRVYAFAVANARMMWKAITSGPVNGTPALYQGQLFAASSDGIVYSCRAVDKAYRWQKQLYGSVTADLVADERGVYVAGQDQSLYLLDLQFGEIRWQARFSGPLYEAPVVTPAVAFQFCADDGLVAVNTAQVDVDQRVRWKLPEGRHLLTVDAEHACVLSRDGTMLVVDIADGKLAETVPAPGMTLGAPSPERTAIYVASPDGRLLCARPLGTPLVTQADVRAALNAATSQPAEPTTTAPSTVKPASPESSNGLTTGRQGAPLGGKSKVSKNFGKGGGTDEPKP